MEHEHPPGDDVSLTRLVEINRVCDGFEAAWRAGRRPAIEEHLDAVDEALRPELLRELLAAELELRRSAGEDPGVAEYLARFPDDVALVEALFARAGTSPGGPGAALGRGAADAGRNLLFGLLALQNNFTDRDALLSAFSTWVADKSRSVGDILLERGELDGSRHALLSALVSEHLKLHGGDPGQSLAALAVGASTRETIKKVGDPDLDASLSCAGSAATADMDSGGEGAAARYSVDVTGARGRRFRVLRLHDKGGLGAVFVALDSELNREVALKQILDRHADEPANRARFLMEAEITGRLEHPGIVPVYGLGTYEDGRPYYAMRFIRGDSLKDAIAAFHADEALQADPGRQALELRKLLRRFLDVCNAIDYAHSRGVLHRDIKPGNVIVGEYGETLVVDWGLAKAHGQPESGPASEGRSPGPLSVSGSARTLPGVALGTPAYMSPEQASGDLDRLGPRSDVYSLGATLYCLLTGRAPFGGGDLKLVLYQVTKGEFPPPRRVAAAVDRALEAICLKAMALRPDDRYATPRALAEDIERWIADEPVTAFPEGPRLKLARWSRRNRAWVRAALAALVVVLLMTAAFAVQQSLSAERERKARDNESQALALAQTRLGQVEKANDLLVEIFDDLDPRSEGTGGQTLIQVLVGRLEKAAAQLEGTQVADPLKEARLQIALGKSLLHLGNPRKALELFERSRNTRAREVGEVDAATLDAYSHQAEAYAETGRPADALAMADEVLGLQTQKLGPSHPDTLQTRSLRAFILDQLGRYAEAVAIQEENLKLYAATQGPDHPYTLTSLHNLGHYLAKAGRTDEAVIKLEEVLRLRTARLGPDHPDTLMSRFVLANAYLDTGKLGEAIKIYEETLPLRVAKLGASHPSTTNTRESLAKAYAMARRYAEAIKLDEETLKLRTMAQGPDHPDTLRTRNSLAVRLLDGGRMAEAIPMLAETYKLQTAKLGADHPETLRTRTNHAVALSRAGRMAEAIPELEETLKLRAAKLGHDHPDALSSRDYLASAYSKSGRWADAVRVERETLKITTARFGPDHRTALNSRNDLAVFLANGRHWDEAIPLLEETLRLRTARLGPDHPDTLKSSSNLTAVYESAGRRDAAESIRRARVDRLRKTQGPNSLALAEELSLFAMNLLGQSKWMEAEPILRECLAIAEKAIPDGWPRFSTMSQLGDALLGQGRFAEAEPLVVRGYEGMKARERTIVPGARPRLTEAAARVVRLYEAWGQPGKVEEWKIKLGLAKLPDDVFFSPR
jgi:serine/threonine protein kinase